jgi:hypothetical protein
MLAQWSRSFLIVGTLLVACVFPAPSAGLAQGRAARQPAETDLIVEVLINGSIEEVPDDPALLIASRVILAPGDALAPFDTWGPTILLVERGEPTVRSDPPATIIRATTSSAAVAGGLSRRDQVLLPVGASVEIWNAGCEPVRLLAVFTVPKAALSE